MSQKKRKLKTHGQPAAAPVAAPALTEPDWPAASRQDLLRCGAAAALFAAAVYIPTTAPAITLLDAADFILGATTLGVVHPPGFPLYTMLGYLFSKLPLGLDTAHQMHLFSAVAAAAAASVLAAAMRLLVRSSVAAFLGAASFALTGAMWSQAVFAEAYALHAALLATVLFLVLRLRAAPSASGLMLVAAATGLALANHYPLTILTAAGFLPLVPFRRFSLKQVAAASTLGAACAALPYAYLFVQSARLDQLAYTFGPMVDSAVVVDWILRTRYAAVDQAGGGLTDRLAIFGFLLRSAVQDFGLFTAVAAFGFFYLIKAQRLVAAAVLLSSLGGLAVLCTMLGFRATPPWFDVAYAYAHSFFLPFAVAVAVGCDRIFARGSWPRPLAVGVLAAALALQAWTVFPRVNQHDNVAVKEWAHALLNSLAKDAVLVAPGDDVLPLYYTQFADGVRPDVRIMDRYGLVTKEKMFHYDPRGDVDVAARKVAESALIAQSDRAVYYTGQFPGLIEMAGKLTNTGFAYRVNSPAPDRLLKPDGTAEGADPQAVPAIIARLTETYPRREMFMDGFRRQNIMRLLAFAKHRGALTTEQVQGVVAGKGLDQDVDFLAGLANEFIIAGDAAAALTTYDAVKSRVSDLPVGNVRSYCQLLINANRRDEAKAVCQVQLEKSGPCDADARYNLAVAHWNDRDKAVALLKAALGCQQDFQPARQLLQQINPGN